MFHCQNLRQLEGMGRWCATLEGASDERNPTWPGFRWRSEQDMLALCCRIPLLPDNQVYRWGQNELFATGWRCPNAGATVPNVTDAVFRRGCFIPRTAPDGAVRLIER